MLSDAALYQSAAHPDKARLVFTTQLHQALKSIAKGREIVRVAPSTTALKPVVSMHDPYGSSSAPFGRATELNGWDLEKKMVALQDVCDLLQRPFFFYDDWATHAAAAAKSVPVSIEKRVNALLYSSKPLPLRLGQTALLDVWDYVMDMCDYVPVRNRCRALYLHVATCICRRVEFIDGYEVDNELVAVDALVRARYDALLLRCVQVAAVKHAKARFAADDVKAFSAHMYTALFFRFPCASAKVLAAVLDTTALLERRDESDDAVKCDGPESDSTSCSPSTTTTTAAALPRLHIPTPQSHSNGSRGRPHRKSTLRGFRSPRGICRHWNALPASDNDDAETERSDDCTHRMARAKQQTFDAFVAYKSSRGTVDLLTNTTTNSNNNNSSSDAPFKRGVRSIDATLERAFQLTMSAATASHERAFFDALPLLYSGNVTERIALAAVGVSQAELLDEVLEPFVDRLTTSGRDELMAVTFVAAFLRDVNSWCAHRRAAVQSDNNSSRAAGRTTSVLWHCVPGYFALVRLFVAVFQLMCQRRPRMAAMASAAQAPAASVGRIFAIVNGVSSSSRDHDPWLPYWSARDVELVLDAASAVLMNEWLVNVLVKVVLESTNMHDAVSVNYSFGILQRVLEVAAKSSASASGATRNRYRLADTFDDEYFLSVMRRALESAHVQILLKVLTCLYNTVDLLPATVRQRVIGDLVLRDNFFRFFMHWNEEIRKIFSYILVFKTAQSNRLDLPCATDRILLAQTVHFNAVSSPAAVVTLSSSRSSTSSTGSSPRSTASTSPQPSLSTSSYWTQLSDMAQSVLRTGNSNSANPNVGAKSATSATEIATTGAQALKRLVAWDCSALLRKRRDTARDVLFRASLENDELSVDLSINSKLDARFKMVADQMNAHHRLYFANELEVYVERGLAQYVAVLTEYYDAASLSASVPPTAPTLAFTITTPVFTD